MLVVFILQHKKVFAISESQYILQLKVGKCIPKSKYYTILTHPKKIKINSLDYKIFINISYIKSSQLIGAENLKHLNHVILQLIF
jgi:hypothetical protein